MPVDPAKAIQDGFDQLLSAAGSYYDRLQSALERADLGATDRERLLDARDRTTQLIEVLESVTGDRIRRVTSLGVAL